MKKKLVGVVLLLALLAGAVYSTLALFSDSQAKKGIITTGQVKIALIEEDGKGAPYVQGNEILAPGDEINRVVSIENIGNKAAWVRVKVAKSFVVPRTDIEPAELRLIEVDYQSKWVEKEGFYYYQEKLAAGAETEPLFKQVKLNLAADNRFSNQKINVDVTAAGIQADHNGTTVADAIGWPN